MLRCFIYVFFLACWVVWIALSHCQSLEFLYVCVCFAKIHKFVFLTNVKLFLSIWKLRNYTENKTNSRKLPKKISRFLSRQLPPRQWHASANIRMCSLIFELFAQYLEKVLTFCCCFFGFQSYFKDPCKYTAIWFRRWYMVFMVMNSFSPELLVSIFVLFFVITAVFAAPFKGKRNFCHNQKL